MSTEGTAEVLVIEPPPNRAELEALLGSSQSAALQDELQRQAVAFATRVAGGRFHTAAAGDRLSEVVGRVFDAMAEQGSGPRPLLVVWPVLPRLGDRHAAGALEDLQSEADVALGPTIDGGLYMLGLRRPVPELLERLGESLESGDLGTLGLTAASEMGLEIGLLRVERGLCTASDVEAALADPLTPASIRALLAESS